MTFLLIAGMIGAVLVIGTCAVWWRIAAQSLLFIAIFEGAIRKWLIPSGSELFYFFKDGVLIGALLGWAIARKFDLRRSLSFFWVAFAIVSLIGLVEVFNPTMASPLVGALGWKAYFLWVGIALVMPDTFSTLTEFVRYLRLGLLVAVGVCLLAVLQFYLPPSHFLNVYAWDSASINSFGEEGNVRVTGTFPFLTGYTTFLSLILTILVPITAVVRDRSTRVLALGLAPLVVGTAFMTGGRAIVFFILVYLAVFLTLGLVTKTVGPSRAIRFLVVPGVVTILVVALFFGKARDAFVYRAVSADRGGDTIVSRTAGVAVAAFAPEIFSWFGDGIGSENNAGRVAGAMFGWPSFAPHRPVEAEPNRVMAELGLFGWTAWYVFKLSIIGLAWTIFLKMRTALGRVLGLSVFCFLGINIMAPLAFDQILAVFYWFAVGIAFGLPRWEEATLSARAVHARPTLRPRLQVQKSEHAPATN